MRRVFLAATAVTLVAVAGCGRLDNPGAPSGSGPSGGSSSEFDKRAAQVAQLWHGLGDGFVPVQGLNIEPRDGFSEGDAKLAFSNGWFTSAVPLEENRGMGDIEYPDGSRATVDLVSAAEAFKAMDQGDGPGALRITAARLGTVPLRTSRGVATVPAWLFTADGANGPIGRVAVAPGAITPTPTRSVPAWDRRAPLVSAQDLLSVNGSTVEFRLGIGACDTEPTGLVWEDAEVIVIGGSIAPPPADQVCTTQLVLHPVKVRTAGPAGNRLIIDALTGAPVLLTPTSPPS